LKILFAFNHDLNPYVDVLLESIRAAGCPVDSGTDKFWKADLFDYDVVHIQWPETLFDWRVPSAIELEFLRRRLEEIKKRATLIFTHHNEVSHHANENNEVILRELYGLLESSCDIMVHLGETSCSEYAARPELSEKRHVVLPIPVYDKLYAPHAGLRPMEARQRLGLTAGSNIVLAFGNFRYPNEKRLVANAILNRKDRRVLLLAPKWHKAREYAFTPLHPMLTLRSVKNMLWARRNNMILEAKKIISDEEVAYYFAAADVVFIQRMDELNSGNIPMAFLFKKVVLGPDCGNIGEWIRAAGNVTFDAGNPASVSDALLKALQLSDTGLGEANYHFAMENWSSKQVGEAHAALYRSLQV
jgi:hypothetical protein